MAKLTGPLMGVNDTGKVLNQKVAKSQIVLINNVGRTLLLGLPPKENGPPIWIYYASNTYIFANTWTFFFFTFQQCSTYKSQVEDEINGPMNEVA